MAALDLDDRERLVIARRRGLQLYGTADRLLSLIEAAESREITDEPQVLVGPQWLGSEHLPGESHRRISGWSCSSLYSSLLSE